MKKLNKFFAILVSLAMMATLCVSMAFATVDGNEVTDKDTYATKDGYLVKELVVPDGVTNFPTVTSNFTFTGEAGSGTTAEEAATLAPTNVSITIDKNSDDTAVEGDGLSKVKAIKIPTLDLTAVPHAGVYTYKVSENTTNATLNPTTIDNATEAKGTLVTDTNSYTVRYTVVANSDGNGYEIKYVTVTKYDDATKKNITIQDPTKVYKDNEGNELVNDGGFSFVNTYKLNQTSDSLASAPLKVTKAVTGTPDDLATKTFPIKITLTQAVGADATALNAAIYDISTGNVVENTTQAVGYGTDGAKTFDIKAGQAVAFLTMPVGTKYVVEETLANAQAYSAYQPTLAVTTSDSEYVLPAESAALGQSLSTGSTAILLKEGATDTAAYTNKYDKNIDTPTGILISNLPYIALALVAIGGLVAYVVVRRKDSDEA